MKIQSSKSMGPCWLSQSGTISISSRMNPVQLIKNAPHNASPALVSSFGYEWFRAYSVHKKAWLKLCIVLKYWIWSEFFSDFGLEVCFLSCVKSCHAQQGMVSSEEHRHSEIQQNTHLSPGSQLWKTTRDCLQCSGNSFWCLFGQASV